jgi:hypothetical protein
VVATGMFFSPWMIAPIRPVNSQNRDNGNRQGPAGDEGA